MLLLNAKPLPPDFAGSLRKRNGVWLLSCDNLTISTSILFKLILMQKSSPVRTTYSCFDSPWHYSYFAPNGAWVRRLRIFAINMSSQRDKIALQRLLIEWLHKLSHQKAAPKGISDLMLSLQTSYVKAINKRYDRVGHLFQGPFKNILVDKNEYLLHLSRYIYMNPVPAGLAPNLKTGNFPALEIMWV